MPLARTLLGSTLLATALSTAAHAQGAGGSLGLGVTLFTDKSLRVDARTPTVGAAWLAGARPGDILRDVEIAGTRYRTQDEIRNALAATHPGDTVTMHVTRGRAPLALRAVLQGPSTATAPAAAPAATAPATPVAKDAPTTTPGFPALGKYGCSESIPRLINGSYEYQFEGRGFVTLQAGGRYVDPYQGAGTFRVAHDSVYFSRGSLDGGNGTPLKDGRLWIVIPVKSGTRRWACSPTGR